MVAATRAPRTSEDCSVPSPILLISATMLTVAKDVTASLSSIVEDAVEATWSSLGLAFKQGANTKLKMRKNATEEYKFRFIVPLPF
jgi:hypothetical protein